MLEELSSKPLFGPGSKKPVLEEMFYIRELLPEDYHKVLSGINEEVVYLPSRSLVDKLVGHFKEYPTNQVHILPLLFVPGFSVLVNNRKTNIAGEVSIEDIYKASQYPPLTWDITSPDPLWVRDGYAVGGWV